MGVSQRGRKPVSPVVRHGDHDTFQIGSRIEDIRIDQIGIDRIVTRALPKELASSRPFLELTRSTPIW